MRKEKQMSTLFLLGLFNAIFFPFTVEKLHFYQNQGIAKDMYAQKRYRARAEDLSSTKNFGVGPFLYKDKQSATKMTASVLNQELNR